MSWAPVGFAPQYEVSTDGQVRHGDRPLKPWWDGRYFRVALGRGNEWRVHRLMAHVFYGPAEPGQVVRHLDDNPLNNVLSNLAYGTQKNNGEDAVRNGRIPRPTHCKWGHEYTPENTLAAARGRRCRVCKTASDTQYRRNLGIPERRTA